jgi:hypothetical protein
MLRSGSFAVFRATGQKGKISRGGIEISAGAEKGIGFTLKRLICSDSKQHLKGGIMDIRKIFALGLACMAWGCQESGNPTGSREPVSPPKAMQVSAALAAAPGEIKVAFRTASGHFLTAENNGGQAISANRTAIGAWEKFTIIDHNGGALWIGDEVSIRFTGTTGTVWYVTADVNGGGPGSILRVNRTQIGPWEKFIIGKQAHGGQIEFGNPITLQANKSSGPDPYVSAKNGGGILGDGAVTVDRSSAGPFETFTMELQENPCPFANNLCLYDKPYFQGQRFNISTTAPGGTCAALASHGWSGRAASAINTDPQTATLWTQSGCTGFSQAISGRVSYLNDIPYISTFIY